jgi:hypothetical protein
MNPQGAGTLPRVDRPHGTKNPFGVMDVPHPDDQEVLAFATGTTLIGAPNDDNAGAWAISSNGTQHDTVEGRWSSRWNGGADPTIAGDAKDKWKQGRAEVKCAEDRLFVLFDWNDGARRGLIEARRDGTARLVGRYINLTDTKITRPWVGLIVSNERIDGQWSQGRLDFRR